MDAVRPGARPVVLKRAVPGVATRAPVEPGSPPPLDTVAPCSVRAADAPAPAHSWKDETFYFVMTDRFANGDRTNDAGADPGNPGRFHGGDWQGIIDHLDDLHDLGATALWISPIVMNDTDFLGMDGYHGYWPHDFEKTEPHFGSAEKLKELVDEAHKRGMKIVVDLVLNHTGYNHPWATDAQHADWFHHGETGLEKGSLWGLPDLAQENPRVSDYLIRNAENWARSLSLDGFRLDAVMHVPRAFVKQFGDDMHGHLGKDFFLLGEAYTGDQKFLATIKSETGLDSMYDFPLSNTIRSVVGHREDRGWFGRWKEWHRLRQSFPGEAWRVRTSGGANARWFHDLFKKDGTYDDPASLMTIVENHDMPRFITAAGPRAHEKFEQALTLQFAFRGIPCLYYGAEDGMGSRGDADLRADKRDGADPALRAHIKSLARMRKDSVALRRGEQREVLCDKQVYAFTRVHPDETVLTVANVGDRPEQRSIPLAGPCTLKDLRTGETLVVSADHLDVHLPPAATRVFRVEPALAAMPAR